MLVKVRDGYRFQKGQRTYQAGEEVDLTEADYQSRRQIFELVKVEEPVIAVPKVEEAAVKVDEPTLENRAILDSTAGAPIIPQSKRRRK